MAQVTLQETPGRYLHHRFDYKWIALSNTTLGILMAALNSSIVLIALPTIFNGIHINPLTPGNTSFLLWILMGYMVVTSTLLVTCGRISDMFGRVRMYTIGFAIFTVGSILLSLTPSSGTLGGTEIIAFRIIQGIGGAFLFANSAAILTDAFPPRERGFGLGINQISAIGGSVVGLVLGGILAAVNWRLVFLVNVPFGVIGTVWAFLGYNPMAHLLPPAVLAQLHAATRAHLLSRSFFPSLIASPFMDGLRLAFYVSAAMSLVAAVASLLRGRQHFHEEAAPAGVASSRGSTASVLARTAPSRSSQSGGPVDRARATQQALPAAPTPSGYPDGHGD